MAIIHTLFVKDNEKKVSKTPHKMAIRFAFAIIKGNYAVIQISVTGEAFMEVKWP